MFYLDLNIVQRLWIASSGILDRCQ